MKNQFKIIRISIITLGLSLLMLKANAQMGIGTSSPEASARLDVTSATRGFLMPKVTIAQKASMTPATGMQVFCTDCGPAGELQIYNGTAWTNSSGGTAASTFICGTSTVTFTYNGSSQTYGTVEKNYGSPVGIKCWLDRNLGASQIATSNTDASSYGDYFQWGRGADGHQLTSSTQSPTKIVFGANSSNFVWVSTNNVNWLTVNNNTLWQGTGGPNNPCPEGFKVPTKAELTAEISTWSPANSTGAYNSTLKIPSAGYRSANNATLTMVDLGNLPVLWSSSIGNNLTEAWNYNGSSWISNTARNHALTVRCIKD